MKKAEKKQLAQDLIMSQLAIIGYDDRYAEFVKEIGSQTEADEILIGQMHRVAKLFGFSKAWFE